MLNNRIHQFSTKLEVAEALADLIMKNVSDDSFFNLAISGGSTPKLLFKLLAKEYSDKIPWKKVKIFWVDERCVPPTDSESNFRMTNEALLKHITIPDDNIYRMRGENNSIDEAKRYQQVLINNLPLVSERPYFDLVLLGMGDDGHTASIFPDNLSLLDVSENVAEAKHPESGQKRVTLTGNVIKNAKNVFFMITGESKAKTLHEILDEADVARSYPTYHILKDTNAEIFADKNATPWLS